MFTDDSFGLEVGTRTPKPRWSRAGRVRECGTEKSVILSSTFEHREPATPHAARDLRVRFELWLLDRNIPCTTAEDLGLAAYEALANAVEHAYSSDDPQPTMHIAAELTDHRISVTITDHGRWQPPSDGPGYRGRGLPLIERLTHSVRLIPSPTGTTIQIEMLPSGPRSDHKT